MSRNAMLNHKRLAGIERKDSARRQTRSNTQGIRITNLVVRNHARKFAGGERSTIKNGFRFVAYSLIGGRLHRSRQKK